MGWTSTDYTKCNHSEFTNEHLKEFLEKEFYHIYQFELIHLEINNKKNENHVCYSVMKNNNSCLAFICIILINIYNNEIYWKEITEDMGPYEDRCPIQFFKLAPCPKNGYAKEWREKCVENKAKFNKVET